MKQPLYKKYTKDNLEFIIGVTNHFGIAIWLLDNEDKDVFDNVLVAMAWISTEGEIRNVRRHKVYYNTKGTYIRQGAARYYI